MLNSRLTTTAYILTNGRLSEGSGEEFVFVAAEQYTQTHTQHPENNRDILWEHNTVSGLNRKCVFAYISTSVRSNTRLKLRGHLKGSPKVGLHG